MKLGILDADKLDSEVIKRYGRYSDMFESALLDIDLELFFNIYSVIDEEYPVTIDDCDAYLLTGSRFSAYDAEPWIHRLQRFIIELNLAKKKLLGICFGHQMIAHSLGGRVENSVRGWGIGIDEIKIYQVMPWMRPQTESIRLRVSHQDQVVVLPAGAKLIAGNDFCPIAAYQIDQTILCFQGHPEFSADYLRHIIDSRQQQLGDKLCQQARSGLEEETDSRLVLQWMITFIKD